jgi:hypothetical protein
LDLKAFFVDRPFLYHLTYSENINQIVKDCTLYSAEQLISESENKELSNLLTERRAKRLLVSIDGSEIYIRDQRPISITALTKCLTDGWTPKKYIRFLNKMVFMWCTIDRLIRHYNRYKDENPLILRFDTKELLDLNTNVKFCRINSGATRPNSHLNGKAPLRGKRTFLNAEEFTFAVRDVAEVTFEGECKLPMSFHRSNNPLGPWTLIKL